MEKKVYELTIDPELRDLIPPLSEEEHRLLEDSILRSGCDTPLTVWNGTIVDGHNRYEICQKHGIPFTYEEYPFESKESAMFWMLEHQLARRNLEPYQRAEITLKHAPLLRQEAAKRQATSTGGADPQLVPNLAQADKKGRSRDRLAKMAKVSHGTIDKVKLLSEKADEETKKKLRAGEISIHKAYTDVMNKEHEGETRVCECCGEEKPYSLFRIPSKSKACLPICKACEAKAKQAAKEAESAVIRNQDATAHKKTGIVPVGHGAAHVSVGLPDDPALFDHVIHLINTAGQAFIANFESTIAQYRPSMISSDHTDMIHQMIDSLFDQADAILNTHLSNIVKEDM